MTEISFYMEISIWEAMADVSFNLMSLKTAHRIILFKVVVDHSQFLKPF